LQLKGAAEAPVTEIPVSEFSDLELDHFLDTYKLSRAQLPSGLLRLIRIARFARLAITLRDQLGSDEDLTEARLVLEDWRSRLGQRDLRLEDENLLRFVADLGKDVLSDKEFSISEKEIHKRLSTDSGRDLEHYRAAINEIVEGLWLTRGDRPHRYKVNSTLLPYVIGLDLARAVEYLTERPAIDDVIAKYEEQLRGADIGVAILRAATSTSFARRKATKVALEALLEAWINSQNFGPGDFEEMWPLISRNAGVFLDVAERTWKEQPVAYGAGEILAKGLANAAKWPIVREELVERLARWVGSYGIDPLRWQYGEQIPANSDSVRRTRENLAAWQSVEAGYSRKISTHFRPDEDDWLPDAALAIVSYIERRPFIEAIVTWAVTRAIMTHSVGQEQFQWLLRLNPEDHGAAEDEILKEASALHSLAAPVAGRAAALLLDGLATLRAMSAKHDTSEEDHANEQRRAWPELDSTGAIIWADQRAAEALDPVRWMERISAYATNPEARLSPSDQERLRAAGVEIVHKKTLELESTFERGRIALALSRWAPGTLGQIARQAFTDLPKHAAKPRAEPTERLEEVNLLLKPEQRETVLQLALEQLKTRTPTTDENKERLAERRLQNMVAVGLVGKAASEQIRVLKCLLPSFTFNRTLGRLLTQLQKSDLEIIFAILATEVGESAIASWLGYIGEVDFQELPTDSAILLNLTRHTNKDIRGQAISLLWSARDQTWGRAFVDGEWSHIQGQEPLEAVCGTHLICTYGAHLDFDIVRRRIVPQALFHLVEARGCQQAELQAAYHYVNELLDEEISGNRKSRYGYAYAFKAEKAWRKIVAMDDGTLVEKTRKAATRGHALGFLNILPLVELVRAVIEVTPTKGAEIWRLAAATLRRSAVSIGDFEQLPFITPDHPETAKLRSRTLDSAKNDAQLDQFAFWSLRDSHESWLLEIINEDLSQASAGRIARGLTLAGFLDCTDNANALWKNDIEMRSLTGWLGQVRAAAKRSYQRNVRARYWFEQYLTATDPDNAFGYLNLCIECLDLRSFLWMQQMVDHRRKDLLQPWLEHLDIKIDARKNRRKKVEDERKKTLFFTPISSDMSPWL